MSHFAKVVESKVTKVIVAELDYFDEFVDSGPGKWVQTSFNTRGGIHYAPDSSTPDSGVALRKNFAGIGYVYDRTRDAFIPPKAYPSWILNEDSCQWDSPVAYPEDEKHYTWDESNKEWVEAAT
jgi:hypothetical protein